jgi:Flp pilus assembly protein TadD
MRKRISAETNCKVLGMGTKDSPHESSVRGQTSEAENVSVGLLKASVFRIASVAILSFTCLSTVYGQENTLARARSELQKNGGAASAISSLEAYRRRYPPNAEVYRLLGIAYDQRGRPKIALAMFRESIRLAPNIPEAYDNLGACYMRQGQLAEAVQSFQHALALRPGDRVSLYGLGLAQLKLGHVAKAIPLLERSFTSATPAEQHLDIGSLLAKNRADVAAEAEYERAVAIDPKLYEAYYNLAVVRFRHKELDASAQTATKALEIRPSAEVHNLLGEICEEQGRYVEAAQHLQEAVRLDPYNEEYVLDLGLELIRHENSNAARKLFLAAYKRFPQSARIVLGLGAADHMQGRNAVAVQAFLTATKIDPDYEPAYTFLGEAYTFAGSQSADVLSRIGHLAQTHTKSFTAQYYYGSALVTEMEHGGNLGYVGEALRTLRLAASLRPGDGRTYYYLGEICLLRGDIQGASRLYRKAVVLNPTLTEALYRLGWAYVKMGRREEAQRVFARQRALTTREDVSLRRWMDQIQKFTLKDVNTYHVGNDR